MGPLYIQIILEFGNFVFLGGGRKTGEPREKSTEQGKKQQETQTNITLDPGIEPRLHWSEVSALTTVPSILPYSVSEHAKT